MQHLQETTGRVLLLQKKPKKGPFQVKETWTHEFFCLAETCAIRVPTRLKKINLQNSGLGRKKVVFKCNDSAFDVQKVLQGVYPKLSQAGGFELLRIGDPRTSLVLITPPVTGYNVLFLRDSAGLGQALAYIRPLQKDLDLSTSIDEEIEQVEDKNVPFVKCIECNENVAMTRFRSHQCDVSR
ncbi:Hypothetical predicted protein [Paramuricea clavata]|uniref:Uncharacterized protein n=1 Tax=Paramuricea clavata TaxID=317549 RepID=A0A6S7GS86_PARCT|nr:Hypothetical predicted protein [Paramuricea clavata]